MLHINQKAKSKTRQNILTAVVVPPGDLAGQDDDKQDHFIHHVKKKNKLIKTVLESKPAPEELTLSSSDLMELANSGETFALVPLNSKPTYPHYIYNPLNYKFSSELDQLKGSLDFGGQSNIDDTRPKFPIDRRMRAMFSLNGPNRPKENLKSTSPNGGFRFLISNIQPDNLRPFEPVYPNMPQASMRSFLSWNNDTKDEDESDVESENTPGLYFANYTTEENFYSTDDDLIPFSEGSSNTSSFFNMDFSLSDTFYSVVDESDLEQLVNGEEEDDDFDSFEFDYEAETESRSQEAAPALDSCVERNVVELANDSESKLQHQLHEKAKVAGPSAVLYAAEPMKRKVYSIPTNSSIPLKSHVPWQPISSSKSESKAHNLKKTNIAAQLDTFENNTKDKNLVKPVLVTENSSPSAQKLITEPSKSISLELNVDDSHKNDIPTRTPIPKISSTDPEDHIIASTVSKDQKSVSDSVPNIPLVPTIISGDKNDLKTGKWGPNQTQILKPKVLPNNSKDFPLSWSKALVVEKKGAVLIENTHTVKTLLKPLSQKSLSVSEAPVVASSEVNTLKPKNGNSWAQKLSEIPQDTKPIIKKEPKPVAKVQSALLPLSKKDARERSNKAVAKSKTVGMKNSAQSINSTTRRPSVDKHSNASLASKMLTESLGSQRKRSDSLAKKQPIPKSSIREPASISIIKPISQSEITKNELPFVSKDSYYNDEVIIPASPNSIVSKDQAKLISDAKSSQLDTPASQPIEQLQSQSATTVDAGFWKEYDNSPWDLDTDDEDAPASPKLEEKVHNSAEVFQSSPMAQHADQTTEQLTDNKPLTGDNDDLYKDSQFEEHDESDKNNTSMYKTLLENGTTPDHQNLAELEAENQSAQGQFENYNTLDKPDIAHGYGSPYHYNREEQHYQSSGNSSQSPYRRLSHNSQLIVGYGPPESHNTTFPPFSLENLEQKLSPQRAPDPSINISIPPLPFIQTQYPSSSLPILNAPPYLQASGVSRRGSMGSVHLQTPETLSQGGDYRSPFMPLRFMSSHPQTAVSFHHNSASHVHHHSSPILSQDNDQLHEPPRLPLPEDKKSDDMKTIPLPPHLMHIDIERRINERFSNEFESTRQHHLKIMARELAPIDPQFTSRWKYNETPPAHMRYRYVYPTIIVTPKVKRHHQDFSHYSTGIAWDEFSGRIFSKFEYDPTTFNFGDYPDTEYFFQTNGRLNGNNNEKEYITDETNKNSNNAFDSYQQNEPSQPFDGEGTLGQYSIKIPDQPNMTGNPRRTQSFVSRATLPVVDSRLKDLDISPRDWEREEISDIEDYKDNNVLEKMNIVEPSDSEILKWKLQKELNDIERDKCDNVINYTRQNETLEDWKGMLEVVQKEKENVKNLCDSAETARMEITRDITILYDTVKNVYEAVIDYFNISDKAEHLDTSENVKQVKNEKKIEIPKLPLIDLKPIETLMTADCASGLREILKYLIRPLEKDYIERLGATLSIESRKEFEQAGYDRIPGDGTFTSFENDTLFSLDSIVSKSKELLIPELTKQLNHNENTPLEKALIIISKKSYSSYVFAQKKVPLSLKYSTNVSDVNKKEFTKGFSTGTVSSHVARPDEGQVDLNVKPLEMADELIKFLNESVMVFFNEKHPGFFDDSQSSSETIRSESDSNRCETNNSEFESRSPGERLNVNQAERNPNEDSQTGGCFSSDSESVEFLIPSSDECPTPPRTRDHKPVNFDIPRRRTRITIKNPNQDPPEESDLNTFFSAINHQESSNLLLDTEPSHEAINYTKKTTGLDDTNNLNENNCDGEMEGERVYIDGNNQYTDLSHQKEIHGFYNSYQKYPPPQLYGYDSNHSGSPGPSGYRSKKDYPNLNYNPSMVPTHDSHCNDYNNYYKQSSNFYCYNQRLEGRNNDRGNYEKRNENGTDSRHDANGKRDYKNYQAMNKSWHGSTKYSDKSKSIESFNSTNPSSDNLNKTHSPVQNSNRRNGNRRYNDRLEKDVRYELEFPLKVKPLKGLKPNGNDNKKISQTIEKKSNEPGSINLDSEKIVDVSGLPETVQAPIVKSDSDTQPSNLSDSKEDSKIPSSLHQVSKPKANVQTTKPVNMVSKSWATIAGGQNRTPSKISYKTSAPVITSSAKGPLTENASKKGSDFSNCSKQNAWHKNSKFAKADSQKPISGACVKPTGRPSSMKFEKLDSTGMTSGLVRNDSDVSATSILSYETAEENFPSPLADLEPLTTLKVSHLTDQMLGFKKDTEIRLEINPPNSATSEESPIPSESVMISGDTMFVGFNNLTIEDSEYFDQWKKEIGSKRDSNQEKSKKH